jgi:homoserine kinase type II
VRTVAPSLYQTLPQQLVHRDYDPSNVLMDGDTVTGVLDFEFCGLDLRVADLAFALAQWPDALWGTGDEWTVMDAFAQGYLQQQPLTAGELAAIPFLFRLRAITTLVLRLRRYADGLTSQAAMLHRIGQSLERAAWLEANEERLSAAWRGRRWQTEKPLSGE